MTEPKTFEQMGGVANEGGTHTVTVIQFLFPDGRRRSVTTELPISTVEQYRAMISAGYRFEAESLATGAVSTTISNQADDVDIEVTPNGPQVQAGMVRMLERKLWESDYDEDEIPTTVWD